MGWRSLSFKHLIKNTPDYQGTAVMNYADLNYKFTRIHEPIHLHPKRKINSKDSMSGSYLGPRFENLIVEKELISLKANFKKYSEDELIKITANELSKEKTNNSHVKYIKNRTISKNQQRKLKEMLFY